MGFADNYLSRYAIVDKQEFDPPHPLTSIVVVIPSYGEVGLPAAVDSIIRTISKDLYTEIVCVVNHPEGAPEDYILINKESLVWIKERAQSLPGHIRIRAIELKEVSRKKAGVGYARKVGMDLAVALFHSVDRPDGIIVAFDADSSCSDGFIDHIDDFFRRHTGALTANHYFEHPLAEAEGDLSQRIRDYELHLRYVKAALGWAGHPFAIHTVGSSFSVRASGYVRAVGMGSHQAGEDFYFLHKMVNLGGFWENNGITVYPSARISNRVVFGTGATMGDSSWKDGYYETYAFDAFIKLQRFLGSFADAANEGYKALERFFEVRNEHCTVSGFLAETGLWLKLSDLIRQTSSVESLKRRFYHDFSVFAVLRYLNWATDQYFPKQNVDFAAANLLKALGITDIREDKLDYFRQFERKRGEKRIS